MTKIADSTYIDAAPAKVWAFINNLSRKSEYVHFVDEVFNISSHPVGKGTKYQERVRFGPRESVSEWLFVQFDPPKRQVQQSQSRAMNATFTAFTTAFAYDRRGYGESGKPADVPKSTSGDEIAKTVGETLLDTVLPGSSIAVTMGTIATRSTDEFAPRAGAAIVAELHEILKTAGVQPPYVLVGHSLGGLYVSLYARTYPEEVASLLLLDSMHPEKIERCKQYLPAKKCDPAHYPWWVKTLVNLTPKVIKAEMAGATETGWQIRSLSRT